MTRQHPTPMMATTRLLGSAAGALLDDLLVAMQRPGDLELAIRRAPRLDSGLAVSKPRTVAVPPASGGGVGCKGRREAILRRWRQPPM